MRNSAVDPHALISALPLAEPDRSEFIETAKIVFERIVERIEPRNAEVTRALWDPERYVDEFLLTEDMLPIARGYALSLIDAFLVHHVIDLAMEADEIASRPLN
jgi:hypothetical protein